MGKWRIGWPSGMSPRRIGPRRVMALPSPFLGGDNVTILVTRTLHFSLFFLHCSLFVCSSRCFLLFRCTSSRVTPSTGITPCLPPLSRLSDAPTVFPSHILPFLHTLVLPSPFGEFCTPLLLSACSALVPCSWFAVVSYKTRQGITLGQPRTIYLIVFPSF
jgi:hypothetical protein